MKNLVKISKNDALDLFLNTKGHPFAYFAFLTKPTLTGGKKTLANFGGIVYKASRYTFVMNREYLKNIQKELEKLGIDLENWKPEKHPYATNIGGNVLQHNNDLNNKSIYESRIYLQFLLHKGCNIESKYFDAKFNEIDIENIRPYFRDNTSKKQTEIGIEKNNQIPIINPSLDNLLEFTLNGIKYEIKK
jgi:hypothetical protein